MKKYLFILFIFPLFKLSAQTLVEKNIEVGMLVEILPCTTKTGSFITLDLYTKTRYLPNDAVPIDSLTGEGVFENFFTPGDFDGKPLPCSYGNKKYKVAALRVMPEKETGEDKRVMLLYTSDKLSLIWVEFDKAIELKEINW